MTMRRMLLGFVGVAMCGVAMAKPPGGNPLSEGRELDPVVRDFQLSEPPATPESRALPPPTEKQGDTCNEVLMMTSLSDAIMNGHTIPLGTWPVESR